MKVNIGNYPGPRSKKERKVDVRIDRWDVWNLDHTLALIIHPALLEMKKNKHGSPAVDDEDVPEHLRSTNAPPKENDWDTDGLWHARWEWVLDEMIWAFSQLIDDSWEDQYYTGETDIRWEETGETDPSGEPFSKMVEGPNHTRTCDWEGLKAHNARIDRGLVLFGKHFRGLWT